MVTLPAFSVVMPSYQQADFIRESIDSVLSQEAVRVELLVMDGGSTDGTVDVLRSYGNRITWVSEPDRGQSHAVNKGIQRATGEYLAWINSDDLLLPGALRRVAAVFDADPEVMWAYGRCRVVDEHGKEIRKPITAYKNLLLRRFSYRKLLLENFISQPATFFRRAVFDEVGLLREERHYDMDYDLWLRLGRRYEPAVVDAYLAEFRMHTSSKTNQGFEESLRAANELVRSYAAAEGKPWLGKLNYWTYYRRTALIYRTMGRVAALRERAGNSTST
jgi:glycosyltransferase involved in cell wall biosynthesis